MAREYDAEEKLACVEEYRNSGMNVTQFAREKQISVSTKILRKIVEVLIDDN